MAIVSRHGSEGARGFTLIEMMVAMTIALVVLIAIYSLIESSEKRYVTETDLAAAEASGRAALDIIATTARHAGYSPLGASFTKLSGDTDSVSFFADLDGDGDVTSAGETDENLTFVFVDDDGDGVYELRRGVDLNGDGDFTDSDESVDAIVSDVVGVDLDDDATTDPFFAYDEAPPGTNRLTVTFGVRTARPSLITGEYSVLPFNTEVSLERNSL